MANGFRSSDAVNLSVPCELRDHLPRHRSVRRGPAGQGIQRQRPPDSAAAEVMTVGAGVQGVQGVNPAPENSPMHAHGKTLWGILHRVHILHAAAGRHPPPPIPPAGRG